MKRKLFIGLVMLLIAVLAITFYSLRSSNNQKRQTAGVNGSTEVVAIPVEGMSCMACVSSIKKGLKDVEGVKEVEVSLEKRYAKVRYQPERVTPEVLAARINQLGYKAGLPVLENSK